MKTCTKCHTQKPLDDFARSKQRSDGRHGHCKVCKSGHDRARRKVARDLKAAAEGPKMSQREYFINEYTFMREQGMKHEQVADAMNLSLSRLLMLIAKYDCRILELSERRCWERIMLCLERGKSITMMDMPIGANEGDFNVAVNIAMRRGMVRRVDGKHKHPLASRGHTVVLYEGVSGG